MEWPHAVTPPSSSPAPRLSGAPRRLNARRGAPALARPAPGPSPRPYATRPPRGGEGSSCAGWVGSAPQQEAGEGDPPVIRGSVRPIWYHPLRLARRCKRFTLPRLGPPLGARPDWSCTQALAGRTGLGSLCAGPAGVPELPGFGGPPSDPPSPPAARGAQGIGGESPMARSAGRVAVLLAPSVLRAYLPPWTGNGPRPVARSVYAPPARLSPSRPRRLHAALAASDRSVRAGPTPPHPEATVRMLVPWYSATRSARLAQGQGEFVCAVLVVSGSPAEPPRLPEGSVGRRWVW